MDKRKFKNYKSVQAMGSRLTATVCLSLLLLAGCQTTTTNKPDTALPDWIVQTPTSDYLIYGVGVADSVGDMQNAKLAAQESARLALAKQLNVTISATTNISQRATEKSMQYHVDEVINSQVPNILLQGVNIEQQYQQGKTAYALASFNRTQATMQTELSIRGIDDEIMQVMLNSPTKSQRLKHAIKVRKLAVKRTKLNDYLSMLQAVKLAKPSTVLTQLAKSEEILNSLSFNITPDSYKHINIKDLLASALTSNGIHIVPNEADFELSFRVNWQHIKKADTFYSIGESFLVVTENGREKAHFNSKVKAASSYAQTAKNNAMHKLADKLSTQLAHFIVSGT
ncbi:hypothetical protein PSECIP111951_01189 [Pseudoalteromonas holothuriae]|uniref:LPP20 lipoprotein n=1 Tax=Pseudoalteromonas holothuriae TaxID=2963714 RepID=A0ABN8UIX3_9GAMM|nr:LPP20 family lipoprotein [Pseudoalteromonas sp. CIP111951]CAH9055185.1 hypothetical protein PSECIP111951_01189 [Pseudoalteromonas sp. CIP111951]